MYDFEYTCEITRFLIEWCLAWTEEKVQGTLCETQRCSASLFLCKEKVDCITQNYQTLNTTHACRIRPGI